MNARAGQQVDIRFKRVVLSTTPMKHPSKAAMTLIAALLVAAALPAQQSAPETGPEQEPVDEFVPAYSLGDQGLSINFGLFVPLFNALSPQGATSTNLSLGAAGELRWESYLSNNMTIGAEVAGAFALSPNRHALFMVPITARWSYIPRRFPYEFPLSVGAGVNFSRYLEKTKVDPIVKFGGGLFWNYSSQWAFGLNSIYWVLPQVYSTGSAAGTAASRIGNYLEFSLSALYHF